jgi:uncharacterized membrane protein YidH (DUF202 family)
MKSIGKIIFAAGILITVFAGFKFITKEKVVDIGSIEITQNKSHLLNWSPMLGIGLMIVGFVVLVANKNK